MSSVSWRANDKPHPAQDTSAEPLCELTTSLTDHRLAGDPAAGTPERLRLRMLALAQGLTVLAQSHLNGLARPIRNTLETTERLGGCQISTVSVLDLRTSVPGSGD